MSEPAAIAESERLAALALYRILDTPPEFAYDALTELAAEICHCPVALISLIDERRAWIKSNYGLPPDETECPREITVCNATLCANELRYVPDLAQDERLRTLPTVSGPPHLRFYCGMPLITRDGHALGTLCVVDFEPHELSPAQREAVRRLAQQAMAQLELRRQLIEREELLQEISLAKAQAETASRRAGLLLRSIFPGKVAAELQAERRVQPCYHEAATILLADFRGFTWLTETMDPAGLIEQLNRYFAEFDRIAEQNRLEILKSVGDSYMCVGAVPEPNQSHAIDACLAALQMQKFIAQANRHRERLRLPAWELRIGINTGSLIAGIVGARRLAYDVWGNTVNAAQRLEAACVPGRVNISASTFHRVEALFQTEPRGSVEVKHMGRIDMYFLDRIRPDYAADPEGSLPNGRFWAATRASAG